jgi:class 3 adenylate cyclase
MLASTAAPQSQQVLEALASYVPALVLRRLASDPSPISAPLREIFPAAVLFTDISGFTPLAERLVQQGPEGLENLSRLLNTHFGELISLVNTYGGEVVKFAGDALLALWPVQSQPPARKDRRDLTLAVRRAAQCALAIQHAMHDHEPMEGSRISLRVGVAAGEVSVSHVGGVFGRWELLVAGAPLERVSSAEQHARPGQVVMASEAWELIQEICQGALLEEPAGLYRLDLLRDPLTLYPLPPIPLSPTMSAGLRAYIPGAILARLARAEQLWPNCAGFSVLFVSCRI